MKQSRSDATFDLLNKLLIILITFIMIYPLYFVLIASVSDPYMVSLGKVSVVPYGLTFEAYRNIFDNGDVWMGYRNSLFYLVAGTSYNLLLTIPAAYVLSKKRLPLRNAISWFFFITMFFSGGIVPTYMLCAA